MWQGPAASRRWSPRSPSWGPTTGAVECPDPGSQWVLVLGVMTWAISRGNAHSGARLEYPLINKVEHVVIESMECGMYHLIWGRMVMSVCPPGSDRFISNSWETQEGDAGTGSVRGCLGAGAVCTTMGFGNTYEWNSAQIEVEFVTNAVAELLKGGYIEEFIYGEVTANVYLDGSIVAVPDEMGAVTASGWVRDTLAKAAWGEEWAPFVVDYGMLPLSEGPSKMSSGLFGGKFPNTAGRSCDGRYVEGHGGGCWARATFARSQIAGCLVAFADFLRCNELIKLKCSDIIIINAEGMVINVQYRENASLVIARTGSVTCPVSMMERYFHMGKLDRRSHGMLFRAIVWTKEGESLRKAGGLSYSRLRELLLDKIAKFGF
ncbi:hypothetical protein EMCRGX_G007784 [Ephydatia muelleri]